MEQIDNKVSPELCFQNVSYQYPKALKASLLNLNLNVIKNCLIAIMGRTGAGKTTLLSTINGLIPHFSEGRLQGQILIKGENTRNVTIQKLVPYVGFVMQDSDTQIFGMTVEKDVAFGPSNLGFTRERIEKNVNAAIHTVELDKYRQTMPDQLSGGEKQRLAVAGILALESPILVFDEPTSELDPQGAESISETLLQLKKTGKHTILFSTHQSQFVIDKADELWVIDAGEIVYQGSPQEFFSNPQLSEKYGLQIPEICELFAQLQLTGLYPKNQVPTHLSVAVNELKSILPRGTETHSIQASFSEQLPVRDRQIVIEIKSLNHRYDTGREAVKDVSVTFYSGEIVGIVGKNGAGKTTLVKHLNGLLKPNSGQVVVEGHDTRDLSIEQLSRSVGYVFQNPDHQIFSTSVYEEIAFGLLNDGMDQFSLNDRIQQALNLTGLAGKEKIHPFNLSKGERQKLAIASVLAIQPRIIVIDEPTTGLDWEGSVKIMEEIVKLKNQGHTLILITHNTRLAAEYVERVIVMKQGQIVRDGSVHSVLSDIAFLNEHSLLPPQMAVLADQLKDYGIPTGIIKVKEMVTIIQDYLRE
jgi:energy-coupling factor transporter ATP-binding protein EcfA2